MERMLRRLARGLVVAVLLWQTACATTAAVSERVAIGLSLVRSPLALSAGEINLPLTADARGALDRLARDMEESPALRFSADWTLPLGSTRRAAQMWTLAPSEVSLPIEIDDYRDLNAARPVVIVALSGGGSRANRMAAHALARLESAYDSVPGMREPLICRIAAFSSVSGGSLYASYVAARIAHEPLDCTWLSKDRGFFRDLEADPLAAIGSRYFGGASALSYFSPLNLFLLPLMTLLTDRGYGDVLANALAITHGEAAPLLLPPTALGDLPRSPRFFFNAVDTLSGAPVVMTQRIHNISGRYAPSWLGGAPLQQPYDSKKCVRSLPSSLTMEDVNSASASLPISYAAVASAAFPPVVPPMALRRFVNDSSQEIHRSSERLLLTDGGVFDNSGMTAAVDLVEFALLGLKACGRTESLPTAAVVISINAETSASQPVGPDAVLPRESWEDFLSAGWPVRLEGIRAINQIHYANKRRAEQIAISRIVRARSDTSLDIAYFSIDLFQLAETYPGRVARSEDVYDRIKDIPSDYVLSKTDDRFLDQAVGRLLDACHAPPGYERAYPCAAAPGSPDSRPIPLANAIAAGVIGSRSAPQQAGTAAMQRDSVASTASHPVPPPMP